MSTKLHLGLLIWMIAGLFPVKGITQQADHDILTLSPEDEEYKSGRYYFHDYFYVFVDSTENRTIEEVAAESFQPHFTKENFRRTIRYGGDMGPDIRYLWGRLTVFSQLDDDEQWLVNFLAGERRPLVPLDSNRFAHQRTGFSLPMHERVFGDSYGLMACLPLAIPAHDTMTVYFRLKRIGVMGLGARRHFSHNLFKPQAYIGLDRRLLFIDTLAIGIMLAVAIYHFFIFFYQRKYVSLFFSFMVLSLAMIILGFREYSHEFLFPGATLHIRPAYGPPLFFFFYFFHYLFSRLYLRLPRLLPVWDKIWLGAVSLQLIFSVVALRSYLAAGDIANMDARYFWKLVRVSMMIRLPLLFLTLVVPVLSWIKGNKVAGIYLLAMFAFVFHEFVNNPNAFFGFVHIPFRIYGFTGHIIMVLLFAMGVASQLKTLQEEKFAAEQAQQAERAEANRIRELDAFKTRFYTNITHQFRTPLTIMLGMIGQVQAHPSSWLNKGGEMIRRNGHRLLQLVDQILTLSRLEAGQLPTRFVQDDVIRYIKYIVESFHSSAEQKNIRLEFTSEPEELVLDYEPDKLMDILSNLISNAIKFTQRGGMVKVEVALPSHKAAAGERRGKGEEASYRLPNPESLLITVADNGPGIPTKDLPRIFDRFYQAALQQDGQQGAGIGLALTRELVNFLKGEIIVESEPGKGAVFSVTLPITCSAPAGHDYDRSGIREAVSAYVPLPETAFPPDEKTAGPEQYTVLMVEDNRDVVEFLRTILPPRFHLVAEYDGEQGLATARELIPDIIISDIMMPTMDGLELCKHLKTDKRTSHIPIILLTAKADMASQIEGLQVGADAYLAKPFNKMELLVRMDKLIELRTQLQERYRDIRFLFQLQHALPEKDAHSEDHFMRELYGIIETNLGDPGFGVGQLCQEMGMSRTQLYNKVKALANHPLAEFIRKARLHKARHLLQTTNLNVTQVSIDVGFKNLSTFSRSFTEEFGINPSEVKRW